MKTKVLIILVLAIISCGPGQNGKSAAENIVGKMEVQLNATSSTMVETDEMFKGQGMKHVLTVEFINCKNIDLMDRSLKEMTKTLTLELKKNIPGSERIDKYKIKLLKDPNDKTPSKSGFNVNEKGFTYNREDFN